MRIKSLVGVCLLVLVFLISGCGSDVHTSVSYDAGDPCVIGTNGDYNITSVMIDKCCVCDNETNVCKCFFESPTFTVEVE